MLKSARLWCVLALVACCAGAPPALAQQWAYDMFPTTSHDFGTLARGAKADFAFTFKNPYNEDVRIKKVQTSCGCAGIKYPTEAIKTYEKKQIVVAVDTRSFLGRKDATLTVDFDQPFQARVELKIHCYIRSDVVFQPGAVQFGSVRQGDGATRKITVSYAGRDDWKITAVESPNPFIQTTFSEVRRGFGRVTYDLSAELKPDAPPGSLSGHLLLRTNDVNTQAAQVPLAIEGVIESELAARPASLTFLASRGGQAIERNVVVQGARPFRVTAIECDDPRLKWQIPHESRAFHVIPVSFTPGDATGKLVTKLVIHTDLAQGRDVSVNVYAEVEM